MIASETVNSVISTQCFSNLLLLVRAWNHDIQKEARLGWIKNSMPAGHMTHTEYNRRMWVKPCEDQHSVSTQPTGSLITQKVNQPEPNPTCGLGLADRYCMSSSSVLLIGSVFVILQRVLKVFISYSCPQYIAPPNLISFQI